MARKFFNQRVKSSKKTIIQIIIIFVCVIGIIICFLVASYFNNRNKKPNDVKIEFRDMVAVEVNSELPDKTIFFSELENVSEDDIKVSFDDVNMNQVGDYKVTVNVFDEEYEATVQVLDTIAPQITLKDLTIKKGETYSVQDFVESCTDNSNEECNIEFYKLAVDTNGNIVDYSTYSEEGQYSIQIYAYDSSNNSILKTVNLTISSSTDTQVKPPITDPPATKCDYGSGDYNTSLYLLAADVRQNGCAISLDLYQNETILQALNNVIDAQTEKIKKEVNKLNKIDGTISLNRNATPVLNITGNGLVGYTLHMELAITKNGETEVMESYDVDINGNRKYTINKFNLN